MPLETESQSTTSPDPGVSAGVEARDESNVEESGKNLPPEIDGEAVRSWLVEYGFKEGDLRAEATFDDVQLCPMAWVCQNGEPKVCQWLYDNGAAEDISKVSEGYLFTPMFLASRGGHLSVCQWLLEVGATEDISKPNVYGSTPMYVACFNVFEIPTLTDK